VAICIIVLNFVAVGWSAAEIRWFNVLKNWATQPFKTVVEK